MACYPSVNSQESEKKKPWPLVSACVTMKTNVDTAQYFQILAIKVCASLGCPYVGRQAKMVFQILGAV